MTIPTARWNLVSDLRACVEEFDPEYRDHYITAETSAKAYENDDDFVKHVEDWLEEEGYEDDDAASDSDVDESDED